MISKSIIKSIEVCTTEKNNILLHNPLKKLKGKFHKIEEERI
jgi:hypothetical protein